MALFSRKPKTEEKAKAVVPAGESYVTVGGHLAHVLRHPRITEKASLYAGNNAYLFDVAPRATKHDIEKAVFSIYKVKPRMIRIVSVPSKRKRSSRTGRIGIKSGGKKAYVYLKKGETITLS